MCIVNFETRKGILLKLYNVMAAPNFLYVCNNWNLITQAKGEIKETEMKGCEASCSIYIACQ